MLYDKEKIIELRKRLGLSMNELARRAQIRGPSMWAIEKGRTKNVRFSTLANIASALGVNIQDILKRRHGKAARALDDDLHALLVALDEKNKLALVAAARALLAQQKKP